jgi:hypothetical protein
MACCGAAVKIGVTKYPGKRLGDIQSGNPAKVHLVASVPGGRELERMLHRFLSRYRVNGEWFSTGLDSAGCGEPNRDIICLAALMKQGDVEGLKCFCGK